MTNHLCQFCRGCTCPSRFRHTAQHSKKANKSLLQFTSVTQYVLLIQIGVFRPLLPSCYAHSAIFPPAQAVSGRLSNISEKVHKAYISELMDDQVDILEDRRNFKIFEKSVPSIYATHLVHLIEVRSYCKLSRELVPLRPSQKCTRARKCSKCCWLFPRPPHHKPTNLHHH